MKIIKLENGISGPLECAIKVFLSGGTVVFPTPTCYGLGAALSQEKGIKKIYLIKGRNVNKPLNIVANNTNLFKKYGKYYDLVSRIQLKYPDSLFTFIVERKAKVPYYLNHSYKTIGIIFAKFGIHKTLVQLLGEPIVGTSANKRGQKECYSIQTLIDQFKNNKFKPDLILDYGELPIKKPSTIIEIINEKDFKIIRQGDINKIEL